MCGGRKGVPAGCEAGLRLSSGILSFPGPGLTGRAVSREEMGLSEKEGGIFFHFLSFACKSLRYLFSHKMNSPENTSLLRARWLT